MKITVKRVEGGDLVTYSCSKCGKAIYEVVLPDGVQVGPIYWEDVIPGRCDCGEVLLIEIYVPTVVPMVTETEYIREPGGTNA